MPGYVGKQLIKYKHDSPKRPPHNPWEPQPIKFGAAAQETDPKDTSPPLDDMGVKLIQQVVGSFNITHEPPTQHPRGPQRIIQSPNKSHRVDHETVPQFSRLHGNAPERKNTLLCLRYGT